MVNGIILSKFDEQMHLIEKTLIKYLKPNPVPVQVPVPAPAEKMNRSQAEDVCKIKIIDSIKTEHSEGIISICLLKDKRLASSSYDKSIIVYNHSYQTQIKIESAHDGPVFSLCALANGELVSSSLFGEMKIWKINNDNYNLLHTFSGHSGDILKIIQLEDGKICSCSNDKTVKIWNNSTYECIKTLKENTKIVKSIIEMKNRIISGSIAELIIWDQSTYQSPKVIKNVSCSSKNGLSKLNENTLLVAGKNLIYKLDIQTYQVDKIQDQLGEVICLNTLKNGLVLIGNIYGEIFCYNSSSNKFIFKNKFYKRAITCIVEAENKKLISCSEDSTINIYDY